MKCQATMTIIMNYDINKEQYPKLLDPNITPHDEDSILRKERQRFVDNPDLFWEEFGNTEEQLVKITTAFVS